MRVLGTSVLVFEAIVVALGIPVALTVADTGRPVLVGWLGAALVALCLVAAGTVTRPWGVVLGWVVQVLVLATAVVVPAMLVLGLVFAALWWAAVHFGRKADALRAARDAGADPGAG